MKRIQLYITHGYFGIRYRVDGQVYQARMDAFAAKDLGYVNVARQFMYLVRAMARAYKIRDELIAKDAAAVRDAALVLPAKRKARAGSRRTPRVFG
jgi:hypothetical protein